MSTRGNLYNRKKEYHIFTNEDIGLNNLGINSYNFSSIMYLANSVSTNSTNSSTTNPIIDEIKSFVTSSLPDFFSALTCSGTYDAGKDPKIMSFDKDSLTYIEENEDSILRITNECEQDSPNLPQSIPEFLKAYNECLYSKDGTTSDGYLRSNILKIAEKIQNSLSGCITFSINYSALGCERTVPIKLRLFDKENADDRRIIAQKGAPIIAGIPQRITGSQYSFNGTENSPIGIYQNPNEGGINNPKNAVAGELDIRFNKTIGKWQSGTHQILARLITDVDSAQIGAKDTINTILDLDTEAVSQVYNPNSNRYIGQFTIGSGVPLSMENGNPYMYGPNYIGCANGARDVEKIRVVNRSNRIFKRGDVVLASEIDGEWIIQGFDLPTTSQKPVAGKWQFQKFIVNSDSFFKDNRFLNNNIRYKPPSSFIHNISPNIYETKMRAKYYCQALESPPETFAHVDANLICKMNLYLEQSPNVVKLFRLPEPSGYDIELSTRYFQSSIFDQVGEGLGGVNDAGNVIGRTNIYKSPTGPSEDPYGFVYQKDLPHFWGPVFPDGFTSRSVGSLISKKDFKIKTNNSNIHKFFTSDKLLTLDTSEDMVNVGIFSNNTDFNFLQLPAEIGLNGPPTSVSTKVKSFSAPIEWVEISTFNQSILPQYFYAKVSGEETNRYSYLTYEIGNKITNSGLYDLQPINPGIIQFSPLQLSTALSSHNITNPFKFEYVNLQSEIDAGKIFPFTGNFSNNFKLIFPQKFLDRNNLRAEDPITYINVQPDIGTGPFGFGPYVNFPEISDSPLGGPNLIPKETFLNERSNLIGIIAAKNKFSTGDTITLKTKQMFGLPKRVTVGTGGNVLVTVIGAFLAWNDANVPASQRGDPQWGDRTRTDAPDSFGTTALHVRIFDEWPDNQTYYDGRYFSILHFNPAAGSQGTSVSTQDIEKLRCTYGSRFISARRENTVLIATIHETNDPNSKVVDKHIIETNVDFYEPTKLDGSVPEENEAIDSNTSLLPQEYWRLNPVRRGALLTGGGFRYYKRVIGLGPNISIVNKGSGYEKNDIIFFPNEAKVKVTKIEDGGAISEIEIIEKGTGYLPSDFPVSAIQGGSGGGAVLKCMSGITYNIYNIDQGPIERSTIKKLSKSSDSGNRVAEGEVKTVIPLNGNGEYDAFYFMHNDILHTLLLETAFTGGFAQYITLEIT